MSGAFRCAAAVDSQTSSRAYCDEWSSHRAMAAQAPPEPAAHACAIAAVPSDMLFTQMAPHVLHDAAALRTTSRAFRANAAVVVAAAARSASLQLGPGVTPHTAHASGAALGSALNQCSVPKNLAVSINAEKHDCPSTSHVLYGMQDTGAHQHVAALKLGTQQGKLWLEPPALSGLAHWPHLQSLDVCSPLIMHPSARLGRSLAQLSGLQSLGLQLCVGAGEVMCGRTLDASHLQQLTQLTSLRLAITDNTHFVLNGHSPRLFRSVSSMQLLRKLDVKYTGHHTDDLAAVLAAALPAATALASLDCDITNKPDNHRFKPSMESGANLLGAIAALHGLHHLGLPDHWNVSACADTLNVLTTLRSLRVRDSIEVQEEVTVSQLLSQLTRLEAYNWVWKGSRPAIRAGWLGQLQEVAMTCVDVPALVGLPPAARIMGRSEGSGEVGKIIACVDDSATEQEVQASVACLLASPAVSRTNSKLVVNGLRAEHVGAVRPLAEAVSCVDGLQLNAHLLPHMAGWHLKRLSVDVYPLSMSGVSALAQSVAGENQLHMESLEVIFGSDVPQWDDALVAVQLLCSGLLGLQRVVLCVAGVSAERQQQVVQAAQQVALGRGVYVETNV